MRHALTFFSLVSMTVALSFGGAQAQDAPNPPSDGGQGDAAASPEAPAWIGASPLSGDDEFDSLLRQGFFALDVNQKDLEFEKRVLPDVKYQLEVMKAAMDRPLEMPDIAGHIAGSGVEAMPIESQLVSPVRWAKLMQAAPVFAQLMPDLGAAYAKGDSIDVLRKAWATRVGQEHVPDWIDALQPEQRDTIIFNTLVLSALHERCTSLWTDELDDHAYKLPGVFPGGVNGAGAPTVESEAALIDAALNAAYPAFNAPNAEVADTDTPLGLISTVAIANAAWQHYVPQIAREIGRLHVPGMMPLVDGDQIKHAGGVLTIAGSADHDHRMFMQPALFIDLGGDDTYEGKVAVADNHNRYTALFDFGDGRDTYRNGEVVMAYEIGPDGRPADPNLVIPRHPGPCAAQGGSTMLVDLGGDDLYAGEDFSLGAAILGAATLHDLAGADSYRGGDFTQGAAFLGWAALIDEGVTPAESENVSQPSNDSYDCSRFGQGFGYVLGYGRIEDTGGNDRYSAGGKFRHTPLLPDHYQSLSQGFGFGSRNSRLGGGIGAMIDRGGNDVYVADVYGQGASYWYALGIAWDEGGNDTWQLGQYGQGAGIHLSAGLLFDQAGDDYYNNLNGVGTGGAHDYAVGWLIDLEGNDSYYSNGLAQGLNNSVALFYDKQGDDTYASRADVGIGAGTNNSLAFLIDAQGNDRYTLPMTNGLTKVRANYGVIVDNLSEDEEAYPRRAASLLRFDGQLPQVEPALDEPDELIFEPSDIRPYSADDEVDQAELDRLWEVAGRWQVGTDEYKQEILDARRRLVELGALEFLIGHLNESYGLQIRALQGTIPHFRAGAEELLVEQLESKDPWVIRNSVDLLTRIYQDYERDLKGRAMTRKHQEWKDRIQEMFDHHRESVMPRVLKFVSSVEGNSKLTLLDHCTRYGVDLAADITPFAESDNDRVRLTAVRLLGRADASPQAFALLSRLAMGDEYFAVRRAAVSALKMPEFESVEAYDIYFEASMAGVDQDAYNQLAMQHMRRLMQLMLKFPQIGGESAEDAFLFKGEAEYLHKLQFATARLSDGSSMPDIVQGALEYADTCLKSFPAKPSDDLMDAAANLRAAIGERLTHTGHPASVDLMYDLLDRTEPAALKQASGK